MTHSPQLIDVSWPLVPGMAIYPGNPGFKTELVQDIQKGDSANVSRIVMGSHTGTHIDAPAHFVSGGRTVGQLSLSEMNGDALVVDATGQKDIDVSFLTEKNIEDAGIILFKTSSSVRYAGKNVLDGYTTLTYEAAEYLVKLGVRMVGIDYMTIERPRNTRVTGRSVHRTLLGNDVLILESLKLDSVMEGKYRLHCFPLNLVGADGSPVRAVLEIC